MARSQCIGCYYKQPHVCNDSEPTLYSPDAISLTGLKLQDQSPAVGDIPEPSAEDEPQLNLDSIPREEPPVNSATPKSPFRLCVVLDREPSVRSGEPKPRPAPRLSPRSELFKSKARSARSTPGSFPYEWPETWEWHPTTPGLLWIWRPWTDGKIEYLLHSPDLGETRRYWLPPGGNEFDFERDTWGSMKRQRDSLLRPTPVPGFHGLASPTDLSDSSVDTAIGEAPGSHFHKTFPGTEGRGLGIWEENTLQLLRRDEAERRRRADAEGDQRRREKDDKRQRRRREKEERRRKREEREREKQEEKRRREIEKKRTQSLYMIRKGRRDVTVTNRKSLGR